MDGPLSGLSPRRRALLLAWYGRARPASLRPGRWVGVLALMGLGQVLVLFLLLNPLWIEPLAPPPGKPGLAILLDTKIRGAGFIRSLYLLPIMTAPIVVALTWRAMFNNQAGWIDYFLSLLHLCGCQGVNGGGWAHYVGQEKVRPLTGW